MRGIQNLSCLDMPWKGSALSIPKFSGGSGWKSSEIGRFFVPNRRPLCLAHIFEVCICVNGLFGRTRKHDSAWTAGKQRKEGLQTLWTTSHFAYSNLVV